MLLMTGGALAATPLTGQSSAYADTFVPTPLAASDPEPNIERCKHWWLPQRNVWTPIGWKGHLFRFNVVYNGALICDPNWVLAAKPNTQPWHGKNFQTTVVMPMRGGGFRDFPSTVREVWDDDLGYGKQGWEEDSDAPSCGPSTAARRVWSSGSRCSRMSRASRASRRRPSRCTPGPASRSSTSTRSARSRTSCSSSGSAGRT